MPSEKATAAAKDTTFEKTMKKSSFTSMTVPSWFVQHHADKFHSSVGVGYEGGRPLHTVHVNVNFINGYPHVAFGVGWKDFAEIHNIVQGDQLKFKLVGTSRLDVQRGGSSGRSVSQADLEWVQNSLN